MASDKSTRPKLDIRANVIVKAPVKRGPSILAVVESSGQRDHQVDSHSDVALAAGSSPFPTSHSTNPYSSISGGFPSSHHPNGYASARESPVGSPLPHSTASTSRLFAAAGGHTARQHPSPSAASSGSSMRPYGSVEFPGREPSTSLSLGGGDGGGGGDGESSRMFPTIGTSGFSRTPHSQPSPVRGGGSGGVGGGGGGTVALPAIGSAPPAAAAAAAGQDSGDAPVFVSYACARNQGGAKASFHARSMARSQARGSLATAAADATASAAAGSFLKGLRRFFGLGDHGAAAAASAAAAAAAAAADRDVDPQEDVLLPQRSQASVVMLATKHQHEQERMQKLRSSALEPSVRPGKQSSVGGRAAEDTAWEDRTRLNRSFTAQAMQDPSNPMFKAAKKLARVQEQEAGRRPAVIASDGDANYHLDKPTLVADGWR